MKFCCGLTSFFYMEIQRKMKDANSNLALQLVRVASVCGHMTAFSMNLFKLL